LQIGHDHTNACFIDCPLSLYTVILIITQKNTQ
jgi:hypothetical protein